MGEGKEKILQRNSHLRMSNSLSNGGCVVEIFLGFSSK